MPSPFTNFPIPTITLSDALASISTGSSVIYYVSPSGSDTANDGLSPAAPLQTIAKVNTLPLGPGEVVLFQGGQTFSGAIVCPASGTPSNPIVFSSYGGGQATINSGTSNGFTSTSQAGIIVRDLTFTGSASTNHGVLFQNKLAGNVHLQNIQAINLNISGYGGNGILVLGGTSGSPSAGYDDILIQGCNVTGCCAAAQGNPAGASTLGALGTAGINVYSAYGQGIGVHAVSHQNAIIENCVVSSCPGVTDSTLSANGITVSEIADCLIRGCTANNNGASANNTTLGGPVGIWCQDCIRVVIDSCAVTGQQDAKGVDGGGFDLDGGCTDCVIRDCSSSGNQRYGFTVESFSTYVNYTSNNNSIVQNCVSVGDLMASGSAGIWITKNSLGVLTNFKIVGCQVYYSTTAGGSCIAADSVGMTGEIIDCNFIVSSNQTVYGTIVSTVSVLGAATNSFVAGTAYQFNPYPAVDLVNPTVAMTNQWGITIGGANSVIAFASSGAAIDANVDLYVARDAAGILQVAANPGSNPAGAHIYNLGAGSLTYERGVFDWTTSSDVLTIGTQANGGGTTLRNVNITGNIIEFNSFAVNSSNTLCVAVDQTWGLKLGGASYVLAFTNSAVATGTVDAQISRAGAGSIGFGTSGNSVGGTGQALGYLANGDPGGTASNNTFSGVSSTTISTGVGVIHMSTGNPATNSGWLKCYIGTQVAWIPCWTTNAP